jgi:hypothetical protein
LGADIFHRAHWLAVTSKNAVLNPRNRLALGMVVFLFAVLSFRSLVDEVRYATGAQYWTMFALAEDHFADLLQAAMSYQFITHTIGASAAFASWPDQFKHFFLDNPGQGLLHYNLHLMPVTSLSLMAAAKLIVVIGPMPTYDVFFAAYIGLVALTCIFFTQSMKVRSIDAAALGFVLLFSYPTLFMLTRGNFNSGFASVLLCIYVVSAVAGKARWFGWACFATAINIRPNVAILGLVEFAASPTLWRAILHIALCAALSLLLFGAAYLAVHAIYPIYTVPNLLSSLSLYKTLYFVKDGGDRWNMSAYAAVKYLRASLGIFPYFSMTAYYLITAYGAIVIAGTLALLMVRKLSALDAVFLAMAICAMFTPVIALYHMVEFACVLPLILQQNRQNDGLRGPNMGMIMGVTLLVISPLGGARNNGLICSILLCASSSIILYRGMKRPAPELSARPQET